MYIGYNIFIKSYLFNLGLYFLMNSASFIILCCSVALIGNYRMETREGFSRKNIVAVSFFQNCAIHQYS